MDPRPRATDPYLRRVRRGVFIGWCLLILGASLYPFNLELRGLLDGLLSGLPRLRLWAPSSSRDAWVNVLLYVPFGALAWLQLERARPALRPIVTVVVSGAAFSFVIELLQHALPPRDPTLVDWALNVGGTLAGVSLALLYRALPIQPLTLRLRRSDPGPAPLLLLMLWIATHLAPFVPRLRPGRIDAAIETSLSMDVVPSRIALYLVCYLILAALVHSLLRREAFWGWFLALIGGSLAARLLFVGQHLSPDEALGVFGALILSIALRIGGAKPTGAAAFVIICMVFATAAALPVPIDPDFPRPAAVSWIPFASLADGPLDPGSLPVIEQLFLGLGIAWLASRQSFKRWPPIALPAAIALGAEFLHHWLPGRLPDTSDLAALIIGAALAPAIARRVWRP